MERNITLDYFKLALSILVVTIHIPMELTDHVFYTKGFLISINRIAVPCFFILNGFFIANKINNTSSIIRYLKKLLILILTWNLIYIYNIPAPELNFFQKISMLFLGTFHLWYLSALFGAILLLYLLEKNLSLSWKSLVCLSFILLVIGYIAEYYCFQKITITYFVPYLYKNFLFLGFPFVTLGYLLHKYKANLLRYNNKTLVSILLLLIILFFLEVIIIKRIGYSCDYYITLFPLCPVLTLFVLKFSKIENTDGFLGNLSQAIYFIHPLSIILVTGPLYLNYFDGLSSLVLLPIILFFTSIFSVGIIEINKRVKIFL